MKKIISLVLALALCAALSVPAFAVWVDCPYCENGVADSACQSCDENGHWVCPTCGGVEPYCDACDHRGWILCLECGGTREAACTGCYGLGGWDDQPHDFSGTARSNGDGTHSRKCVNTGCECYGEPVPCADMNDNGLCDACNQQMIFNYTFNNGELIITGNARIPDDAFKDRMDIKYVIIGEGITGIGNNAFSGCKMLESIEIPETVTSIGESAFCDCKKLTSVVLPANLKTLGKQAFGYSGITNINIPASLSEIKPLVFFNCPLVSLSIPSTVQTIGDEAFRDCNQLKDLSIAEGVKNIGKSAFHRCLGLTELEIPKSVVSIDLSAFAACVNLNAVLHYTTDKQIEYSSFDRVKQLTIRVPGGRGWSIFPGPYGAASCEVVPDAPLELGTEDDPYLISSPELLADFAQEVAGGKTYSGAYFKLTQDFSYNGSPIGSSEHPFMGVFDGDGHTLTLDISTDGAASTGLFAEAACATIKNIEIAGTVSGAGCVGGVVGYAYKDIRIDNCHVSATVTGSGDNVGGVVGRLYANGMVTNCRVDGTVKGSAINIGGIVGALDYEGKVLNCVKTGETIGGANVGGITGQALWTSTVISNCASFGSVTGASNCGGIIGLIPFDVVSFTLYCSYSNCNVSSEPNTDHGYICGKNENEHPTAVKTNYLYYTSTEGGSTNNTLSATVLTASNKTEAINTLNKKAEDYGEVYPGVRQSTWSEVGGTICPASCQGFEVAPVASTLSEGNVWIIVAIAAAAVVAVGAIVIVRKKSVES